MLSKAQNNYIRSLASVKGRREAGAYVAEGSKLAAEWLQAAAPIRQILATETWASEHTALVRRHPEAELILAKDSQLATVSQLQSPPQVLVVAALPEPAPLPVSAWCLVCDTLQDPGNVGTLIRIADWFGIAHVVCSPDSADAFGPKVVQAGMGGHLRVQLHQTDLAAYLPLVQVPVLAAVLDGDAFDGFGRLPAAALLIGNESRGLSPEVLRHATRRVTIPRRGGAESLNAAVSAGILCAALVP